MLGTRFRISTDVYESLQEIADRYVAPCEKIVKESIAHPKFKDITSGSIKFLENLLLQEKKAKPSNIPYYFAVSPQYPQFFILAYLPKEEIIKEFIKVKPKGLFFHEAYHVNMNYLVSWFKRHYTDRVYKNQLARSKPPMIDTTNFLAIPGKAAEAIKQIQQVPDENLIPTTPQRANKTPGYGDATPFDKTPHIGAQEWAGGKDLTKTPRADDYEMSRNYENFGAEEKKEEKQEKKVVGWGEEVQTS